MAKDFEKDLNELIKGHQDNEEQGARSAMVSQLRTAADLVSRSEPWPGEIKASEAAIKAQAALTDPKAAADKAAVDKAAADKAAADKEAANRRR